MCNYARPNYYWGYNSTAFNALVKKRAEAARGRAQVTLYADIQRQIANDAVNAFIFNPSQVSVSRKGLKGLWANSPVAANDLSQVSWQ
jgi:peptide/nickel transport system substrate-binding protein